MYCARCDSVVMEYYREDGRYLYCPVCGYAYKHMSGNKYRCVGTFDGAAGVKEALPTIQAVDKEVTGYGTVPDECSTPEGKEA